MKFISFQLMYIILLVFLATTLALAENYRLFDHIRTQVSNYDSIVENLKPGDKIIFSDNQSVIVGEKLGSGNTTVIFELPDYPKVAIRIPKKRGIFKDGIPYTGMINRFQEGYSLLKLDGVPTVNLFKYRQDEYAVVERLGPHITFADFLKDRLLPGELKNEMSKAFLEFAKSTAKFTKIGDFHSGQIVYDKTQKKWILMDWERNHVEYNPKKEVETTAFNAWDKFYGKHIAYKHNRWYTNEMSSSWIVDLANDADFTIHAAREKQFPKAQSSLLDRCKGLFGRN